MIRRDKTRAALRGLLNDWYGPERGDVELAGHGPQPRLLGESVDRVLESVRRPELGERLQIESHWQEIAGPVAALAVPVRIQDGVLELEVRHSAMALELRDVLELLLQKLHAALPEIRCKEIRFTIAGGVSRRRGPWKKGQN